MFDHAGDTMVARLPRRISVKRMIRAKPNAIHIRQPSLSHSVSSAASSPTSSTHSVFSHHRHTDASVEFDPLLMHPTHSHPPARLADRAFIARADDDTDRQPEAEPSITREEEDEWHFLLAEQHRAEERKKMAMPPVDSPTPLGHTGHDRDGGGGGGDENQPPSDYFLVQKRPALPRSHWSASTIQTTFDATPTPQQDSMMGGHDSREIRAPFSQCPNFSYKRSTGPPKRPPLRAVDSVENFMKRGGWKRRGIVFQQDPAYKTTHSSADDAIF